MGVDAPDNADEEIWTAIGLFGDEWKKLNLGPVNYYAALDNARLQSVIRGVDTMVVGWDTGYRQL